MTRGANPLRVAPPFHANDEQIPVRDTFKLTCAQCGRANYVTSKNKRTMAEKFEIKKYCAACNSHQSHKEGKISKG